MSTEHDYRFFVGRERPGEPAQARAVLSDGDTYWYAREGDTLTRTPVEVGHEPVRFELVEAGVRGFVLRRQLIDSSAAESPRVPSFNSGEPITISDESSHPLTFIIREVTNDGLRVWPEHAEIEERRD